MPLLTVLLGTVPRTFTITSSSPPHPHLPAITSSTMAFHVRCPHEISAHIVSYLPQSDLATISRVSHQLYTISQPLLYKEPCIITGNQSPVSVYIFLRTLLTPGGEELVNHVRWLTLHWTNQEMDLLREPDTDTLLLTRRAASLGLPDPIWHSSALVVLLLRLLPRLQTLHVVPAHDRDHLDEFISTNRSALQSLREFRWYSANWQSGVTPRMLFALLALPCIRIIDVHMVTELPLVAPAPGSSLATHLEFSFGQLSARSLGLVLLVPRALTHFTYRAVSGHRTSMAKLAEALRPVRDTLQHLDLDLFRCIGSSPGGVRDDGSIGSLKTWPALRSVRCSLVALVGSGERLVDVLPLGLRALETVEDHVWKVEEVVREVVALVVGKQTAVPRLCTVAVHVGGRKSEELMVRLKGACVAGGVRLVEGTEKPFL